MPDAPLTPVEITDALESCKRPPTDYERVLWDARLQALAETTFPRALRALQQRAEDTERLGWWLKHGGHAIECRGKFAWYFDRIPVTPWCDSPRAAIDAARKGLK